MADQDGEAAPAKKPIGSIIVTAIVSLGLGAGGSFAYLQKMAPPVEVVAEGEAAEGEGAEEDSDAAQDFQNRLLQLAPLIVNIAGEGHTRLLKLTVELECESPEVRAEAEARVPQIRDGTLTLVSSKRLADVMGFEGKTLLKDDLRDRINQILTSGHIVSVLFTEFVIQ